MKYESFIFEDYSFDKKKLELSLRYSFDGEVHFEEKAHFDLDLVDYDDSALKAATQYTFIACGTSYFKAYYPQKIDLKDLELSLADAVFFNELYLGGLSQYIFENDLDPKKKAKFEANGGAIKESNVGDGILLMQSGGKDSLLAAELLKNQGIEFSTWHLSTTEQYPEVIDKVDAPLLRVRREIDSEALANAEDSLNGHVPFSAILAGYAAISAILSGKNTVLAANESSADEANVETAQIVVNHQYSKTSSFERELNEYFHRNISPNFNYGSIIRKYNELEVAEKFVDIAWDKYGHEFSSCNLANYKQQNDNRKLKWDGNCSKCANAWLLFAPFVDFDELSSIFSGKNLSADSNLTDVFRQLLGLSAVKPFECVGSFEELNKAYFLAVQADQRYKIEGIEPIDTKITQNSASEQQFVTKLMH